jgi:putative DNA primase/helicase
MAVVIKLPRKRKPSREDIPLRGRRALAWLERGAALVPLAERDKTPINKGGSRQPLKTWREVRKVFAEHPDANYGIVTGTISGLVVLDVDEPEGQESLHALKVKHGRLPKTVTVMTARGYHLYFRQPGKPIRNSASRLGPGLDVRGEGGYVVGVGSVHPSGDVYD